MNAFQVDVYQIAASLVCPYCGAPVEFKSNEVIYKRVMNKGFVYICSRFPDCDSYVGIHGSGHRYGAPLGTLANKNLRDLRKSVHRIVMPYAQQQVLHRKEVYRIISKIVKTQIEGIAQLNSSQCVQVLNEWFYYVKPLQELQGKVQKRF